MARPFAEQDVWQALRRLRDEGHGFDAVAVGIADEGRIITLPVMRPQAGGTVRGAAGRKRRRMEPVDGRGGRRAQADMDAVALRAAVRRQHGGRDSIALESFAITTSAVMPETARGFGFELFFESFCFITFDLQDCSEYAAFRYVARAKRPTPATEGASIPVPLKSPLSLCECTEKCGRKLKSPGVKQ